MISALWEPVNGDSFGASLGQFGHLSQPRAQVVSPRLLRAEQKGLKMVYRAGQEQGVRMAGIHGQVGGAGRVSAAKLRPPPPNKLWRLMKSV